MHVTQVPENAKRVSHSNGGNSPGRDTSALSVVDTPKIETGNPIYSKEMPLSSVSAIPEYDDMFAGTKNGSASKNVVYVKPE